MKPRNVKFSMVIERPVEHLVDAYKFVSVCGIEKCRRILDRAPTQEPRIAKSYSDKTGSYYGDHNNHSVCLEKLREAVEDFELVAEYKLPEDFLSKEDEFGLQGTWLYLDHYAFYSNDEEKAVLDRLQLALDRITKGLESNNDQAISKVDNQIYGTDLKKYSQYKQELETIKQGEAVKQSELTESHINETYKLNKLG